MIAVVLFASVVALGAWIVLFRRDDDDIWPRTWAVAAALLAFSVLALVVEGELADTIGPVGVTELAVGAGVGTAWLIATHIGHAVLCRLFPSFVQQVQELYRLGVADPWWRVLGPITAMAVAEELLFRGVIQGRAGLVAGVAVYTAVQFVERKWALALAALLGGLVWGALFELTGGLVAPIVAHALWTVSLTLVLPLRGCGRREIRTPADDPAGTDERAISGGRRTG